MTDKNLYERAVENLGKIPAGCSCQYDTSTSGTVRQASPTCSVHSVPSKSQSFEDDIGRIAQLRRLGPGRPDSHDVSFLLGFIDRLWKEYSHRGDEIDRWRESGERYEWLTADADRCAQLVSDAYDDWNTDDHWDKHFDASVTEAQRRASETAPEPACTCLGQRPDTSCKRCCPDGQLPQFAGETPLKHSGECICPTCGIRHGTAATDGGF